MTKPNEPEIVRTGFLDMQVCVPKDFTDEQVLAFAESANSCGTTNGWFIRRQGDKALSGDPERNQCDDHPNKVHIALDA